MKQKNKPANVLPSLVPAKAPLRRPPAAKAPARSKRPLHVHIALHPMSILLLLCMGVLLVSFTLNAVADSYLVTAVVPAAALSEPATIDSPADGIITGTRTIVVRGTCPAHSYVDLFDNGRFVGAAICNSDTFNIGVELVEGNNRLQAQDYNITNAPGPTSGAITVSYVPGAPEQSAGASGSGAIISIGQLVVTQVDIGVPYKPSGTLTVSSRPTIAGIAPPLSRVTVQARSRQNGCTATASAQGYWKCTITGLSAGKYTLGVAATTLQNGKLTFPDFSILVHINQPPVVAPLTPLVLSSSYSYTAYIVGQTVSYTVSLTGGSAPYALVVSWGDGTTDLTIHPATGRFTFSHTYGWISAAQATKTVRVQAIDSAGQGAMLQLDTVVRNPAYKSAIANITKSSGLWGLFGMLRPWLWLLWPGYLIVLLLVISFWLGEHQELLLLKKKRRQAALKGKRRHARASR